MKAVDTKAVDEINVLIRKQLDVHCADIRPEMRFVDDLGADSLAVAELTLLF